MSYLKNILWIIAFIIIYFIEIQVQAQDKSYAPDPKWYGTYDIKFYSINLDVTDTNTYIQGNTLVQLKILESTDSLIFDFNTDLVIDSINTNNKISKQFYYQGDHLIIHNQETFKVMDMVNCRVYYHGTVNSNSFFSSLSSQKDSYWKIPVTWTLSEPFGAKHWFPCKQQLSDKADSCWVSITVPKGRKAGSVGILIDTVNLGNSKTQYNWKTKYPIAFYLISFTVSDYSDYSFYVKFPDRIDSMVVKNYIYNRPGYLENNKADIDKTTDFLKVYSKYFGLYPFYSEKYGHCVAPIGGGMEHQTMTTLINFSYSLVSHELAHQWFGDYVTCKSWQDIWINEGFASYCEYLAYELLGFKNEADSWMTNAQGRALREPEGSVFIPASESQDEFRIFSSNLSYKKGATILHMLRNEINNDTVFFKGLKTYLDKYKFGNASGDDFRKVMESTSGIDFTEFFDQWYYGKGYPQFDISWKSLKDTLQINIQQSSSSKTTPFFSTSFDIHVIGNQMDTIIRLYQHLNPQNFTIILPSSISSVEFDPQNWILKKILNVSHLPEIPSIDDYFIVKPNPFSDSLNITFKTESAKDEKIKIVSLSGKVIYESNIKRKRDVSINTFDYNPGVYLLYVSHGMNNKYVRKIVKVESKH
jgi:aminopeptidase N